MSSKDTWAIFVGDLFKPQCFTCHSPWVRCLLLYLAHVLYCFNMFRLELIPSRSSVQANEIKMLYRTYAELVAASGADSTDS